eukprot:jgi/Mesen1/7903/ME000420S07057
MGRSREKISQLAALEQLRDSLKASLKDAQLLLEAPAVAGANKVGKAECVGAADLVSKNATKASIYNSAILQAGCNNSVSFFFKPSL